MDELFHVVLAGVVDESSSKQKVVDRLAHLFDLSPEVVEQLFNRAPVVVKRAVDQATAIEYQQMLAMAGAACEIRPVPPPPAAVETFPQAATAEENGDAVAEWAQAPATERNEPPAGLEEDEPIQLGAYQQLPVPPPAEDPHKGATILTIDERVLERAAVLASLPEESVTEEDDKANAPEPSQSEPEPSPMAGKCCPKCGYVRLGTEVVPDYECPKCGIVYFKYEAYLERQKESESVPGDGEAQPGAAASRKKAAHSSAAKQRMTGSLLIIGAIALAALAFYWIGPVGLLLALPLAIWGGLYLGRSQRHLSSPPPEDQPPAAKPLGDANEPPESNDPPSPPL